MKVDMQTCVAAIGRLELLYTVSTINSKTKQTSRPLWGLVGLKTSTHAHFFGYYFACIYSFAYRLLIA